MCLGLLELRFQLHDARAKLRHLLGGVRRSCLVHTELLNDLAKPGGKGIALARCVRSSALRIIQLLASPRSSIPELSSLCASSGQRLRELCTSALAQLQTVALDVSRTRLRSNFGLNALERALRATKQVSAR